MEVALDKMFGVWQGSLLLLLLAAATTFGKPSHLPPDVFEVGDMLLTAEQVPSALRTSFGLQECPDSSEREGIAKSPGIKDERYRWPGGVLNYELSNEVSSEHAALIRTTLSGLETKLDSCIKFRETRSDYRVVVDGSNGCASAVGYRGGLTQKLSLSPSGCMSPSTIEHEFLHAIGVHHTQSRTDRDSHVKINFENIQEGSEGNFHKYDANEVDDFGLPYDFHSVMHYVGNAFSKNPSLKTIETLDPSKQDIIGRAQGVSEADIMLVKKMYKCTGTGELRFKPISPQSVLKNTQMLIELIFLKVMDI